VTSSLDAFTGPRAGCLDIAALVLKIFLSSAVAPRRHSTSLSCGLTSRRWWRAPHAAVRLLCTQEPVPKEDDLRARAPVSETGLLVSAEAKRRTTTGGGILLTWQTSSLLLHHRRRWHAPHATVRLLHTRRPTPKEHDSWARAPVPEAGPLLSAEVKRRTTVGGGMLLTWQFAFFAHGGRRPRIMTRGLGPPCQRLGHLGARRARSSVALRGVSGGILL
jgi:hypothetical protein